MLLQVTDSGPGLTPEQCENLFRPFFSTKAAGKGTGLGLSLSSQMATSQGGQLYYDKRHANTSFVLELPKQDPRSPRLDSSAPQGITRFMKLCPYPFARLELRSDEKFVPCCANWLTDEFLKSRSEKTFGMDPRLRLFERVSPSRTIAFVKPSFANLSWWIRWPQTNAELAKRQSLRKMPWRRAKEDLNSPRDRQPLL